VPRVLFRVEAGKGVGLGHLQRCLSLASALRNLGSESLFVATGGSEARERVEHSGFEVVMMNLIAPGSDDDMSFVGRVATDRGCAAVVTDSYHINSAYQATLRTSQLVVVGIDDLGQPPFTADLIVNGSVLATSLPYSEAPEGSLCLLGPSYAMLAQQYSDAPVRDPNEGVVRILITMGGTDSGNFTSRLISALDSLHEDFSLDIIVGPFNPNGAEIAEAVRRSQRTTDIQNSPASLFDSILSAQLVISAAGQTLYELAATGTPTVAVQTAENQMLNSAGFLERGCVLEAALSSEESLDAAVVRQVRFLLASRSRRIEMSKAGPKLVDGQGAFRVARAIIKITDRVVAD
jgi:UDP-2,4-diacetamido-2,4,6-trideoxy-beta-L-altropyranose hydrolase